MSVAVVVPFRGGCPHREAAWAYIQRLYAQRHPDWQVIEAFQVPESGTWRKATAINPAVESCDAEIIIQADADIWTEGLADAVEAVEDGALWALPHTQVRRLSAEGTAAVLTGAPWADQPLAQRSYQGIIGGGYVVAPRVALQAVPLDPRFVGWGNEDEAHAMALSTLLGEPWRGAADLIHLWHPPQERWTRRRGSRESWALRQRYAAARDDHTAMSALIEESRDASQAHQHSLHHCP